MKKLSVNAEDFKELTVIRFYVKCPYCDKENEFNERSSNDRNCQFCGREFMIMHNGKYYG